VCEVAVVMSREKVWTQRERKMCDVEKLLASEK
jgi:hypothetical protein